MNTLDLEKLSYPLATTTESLFDNKTSRKLATSKKLSEKGISYLLWGKIGNVVGTTLFFAGR